MIFEEIINHEAIQQEDSEQFEANFVLSPATDKSKNNHSISKRPKIAGLPVCCAEKEENVNISSRPVK